MARRVCCGQAEFPAKILKLRLEQNSPPRRNRRRLLRRARSPRTMRRVQSLRLNATSLRAGEAGLDFGARFPAGSHVRDLSHSRNLDEAAANVFALLRELDGLGLAAIAVAPIPEVGLGEAINDRLKRAAAPRS